jgi:hypothetical protein
MKLSTGVMVLYADEESFTLMTPQGHMFAGWITFSATSATARRSPRPRCSCARRTRLRAGPDAGGHKQEDRFWNETLANVAAHFGEPGARSTPRSCASTRSASGPVAQRLALERDPLDALPDRFAGPRRQEPGRRPAAPSRWRDDRPSPRALTDPSAGVIQPTPTPTPRRITVFARVALYEGIDVENWERVAAWFREHSDALNEQLAATRGR